jgi:hypothetical protein
MLSSRTLSSWLGIAFVTSLLAMLLLPLPSLGGTLSGHAAGIIGTLLVLGTLIYPFRKRVLGRKGRNNPITTHMVLGLLGSLFLVAHSGGRFPGLIVTLTFLVTVAVVLSGMSGMFFFFRVRRTLGEYRQEAAELKELFHETRKDVARYELRWYFSLESAGDRRAREELGEEVDASTIRRCQQLERLAEAIADVDHSVRVYHATQKLFGRWSLVHVHLAFFLFAFTGAHVATSLYYGVPWL